MLRGEEVWREILEDVAHGMKWVTEPSNQILPSTNNTVQELHWGRELSSDKRNLGLTGRLSKRLIVGGCQTPKVWSYS